MFCRLMRLARRAVCAGLALALFAGQASADPGGDCCCQRWHCPPPYYHCQEGPPCIKFQCGCPKPVCGPCDLQHWGYFETCWRPWPFPPDWTHCPVPPPSAQLEGMAMPAYGLPTGVPGAGSVGGLRPNPDQSLPPPRRGGSGL
jgi:hypothetical protein